MSISFGGIGQMCVTFIAGTVDKGEPVKMSANGTVTGCSSGDRFMGVAIDVTSDGFCTVQTNGYAVVPYSGTAPSVGFAELAADGSGGVKSVESGGGEFLVIDVDTTNTTVGIII